MPKHHEPHPDGLSEKDVSDLIKHHRERRGSFPARPVLIQCLEEFGAPHRGVLTAELGDHYTVATLMSVQAGDKVVLYDDDAPSGPRSHSGIVTDARPASRPSDTNLSMNVIYLQIDD